MVTDSTTVRRSEDVEFRSLGEDSGGVILRVSTGAYHGVNEVGALVWGLIDEGVRFGTLIEELEERLEDAPPTLRDEISQFIDELAERELVVLFTSEGD